MFKRVLAFILVLIIVSAPLSGGAATVRAASDDDLKASIEKQIRAFADSIDQSNAADSAAAALAMHGIKGSGKVLKAGKSHALTATLFNSELLQAALIDSCTEAITIMQNLDLSSIPYAGGIVGWYEQRSQYYLYTQSAPGNDYENWLWEISYEKQYSGKQNSYDSSLNWMAGSTGIRMSFERTKTTATEQTYKITCTIADFFDFDTSSGSGFDKLISGIGAVLFREFEWESTVTFNLTVPYNCSHSWGSYHWSFDSENGVLTPDSSNGFTPIGTTEQSYTNVNGYTSRYFELDKTLRLLHNKPWVMEYDIIEAGNISFASQRNHIPSSVLTLTHYYRKGIFAANTDHVLLSREELNKYPTAAETNYIAYQCGTYFDYPPAYSPSEMYTYRLENKVNPDGSNVIYVTVSNTETGQIIIDNVPLDDYYSNKKWVNQETLVSSTSDRLSGLDLYINYFGKENSHFVPNYFDLRIWENGEDGGSGNYYTAKVTKPTCTTQGYTTYTCSLCGYSYKGDKVKATGHSYGEWEVFTPATCTESGEEQRKCKTCDAAETREIAAAGHNFENYVCTGCGERKYPLGDVDLNGTIDVDDVLTLLWNVLFPDEYPIKAEADFDGNGTTDVDDVLTLLWHVLFPEEYPLN